MDLNFGEIVLDPVSRAFFDDYDEEITFQRPEITWKISGETESIFKNVDHLIVVEGQKGDKLTKTAKLLKNTVHICTIRNTNVYRYENSPTVLCISEERDVNYYSSICDLLHDLVENAKEVTLVSLQRLMDFKSDKILEGCIIRGLNSKFDDVEPLSCPNFITGIAAAVATKRMFLDSSFCCYIIYMDSYDGANIKKVLNLFNRVGLKVDDSLKIESLDNDCNLYM